MFSQKDRDILRELAARKAEIAALPVHEQTIAEWKSVNQLRPGRPMLWINELPWHELNVDDELTLRCEDEWARGIEGTLRRDLYQWEHMRCDMVVPGRFDVSKAIQNTGFGMGVQETTIAQGEGGGISSHGYEGQIKSLEDVRKIQNPVVTHDENETQRRREVVSDLFGDLLEVRSFGVGHLWYSPWDALIQWYGVNEAMLDLAMNPELVHAAVARLTEAYHCMMDQYVNLNLLSPCHDIMRVGSGGAAFTDELPAEGFDPEHVRTIDQWGCAVAQIFSEVSPAMHEEFELNYARPWMEKFGLVYYGCCEPLDRKVEILRSIPNLRKISMSPWVKIDRAAEAVGGDYVFSYKPTPAVFATDAYNAAAAEATLREVLERTRGMHVEIIMKDVSTCRQDPRRVWQWCEMAARVVREYAP